jgi:hypothetical protein
MATYYVRVDGNDSNTGTGSGSGQAWQTITKALGATGIGSGDTLYIAPGDYRQSAQITIGGTYTAPTFVYGNPTASQFSGLTPGRVLITTRLVSDTGSSNVNQYLFVMTSKDYLNFENLICETATNRGLFSITNCVELKWRKCLFMNSGVDNAIQITDNTTNGLTKNYLIQQCHFVSMGNGGLYNDVTCGKNSPATADYVYGLTVDRCVCIGSSIATFTFQGANATYQGTTFNFYNNTGFSMSFGVGAGKSLITIRNHITQPGGSISMASGNSTCTVTNNVSNSYSLGGTVVVSNNFTNPYVPFNTGIWRLWGMTQYDWFSANGLYTYAAGSSTGTPATDFYGDAWTGGTPNIGSYNNTTATIAGQYNPTERNASTITIAPASTSQSIELYLGATGLTFATSGLAAYYVRNKSAAVAITLVTQTATGAWSSGGFAEISSSLVPGVYRLDVPNAAFAAGASDVTIVVRGASGTNGAVLTVTLSSGGLTAAQTAAAVWDEPYTSHTTASTFGARTLKTTVDNRPADVGTSNHIQANVHAIVDSTAAASELSGALLHNGTDYISAELVTPVTQSALVRMGPYQVIADGVATPMPLDIQKGAQHGVDIQCVDNNLSAIDITGATITAKVYNSGGTLVATYSGTATYAADGRAQFTITTTVTNTPGTYTATITRTTGASDTQVFGPLRIYVRDI